MGKKVYGTCCICGQKKELTFEHIPPRAAFNRLNLKLYDFWEYLSNNNTRYTPFQKGAGRYSLCASCNNRTGEWYGAAYAEFARQGMLYCKQSAQGLLSVPYEIYPLRVLKQVISCFASINGAFLLELNPILREFLLNPYEQRFPKKIDIRMYLQNNRGKANPICGQANIFTGEHFTGSEMAHPPFSFIYICDRQDTNYRVLNELYSIIHFTQYDYDERVKLYLNIPTKPCNMTPLDFREGIPDIETIIKQKTN